MYSTTHIIGITNSYQCRPVNITLSAGSLWLKLTTLLKRNALPVEPVNLVEISSSRLVKNVSP